MILMTPIRQTPSFPHRTNLSRRRFLRRCALPVAGLAVWPVLSGRLIGAAEDEEGLRIAAIEVLKVAGPRTEPSGINRQHQVQPIHLYREHRPAEYRDAEQPANSTYRMTHHYVRIRTRNGLEGLYGYVDPEALPVLRGSLQRLLVGRSAIAVEKNWDLMYRSNRHSRTGHYMMAISAVDNCLWDLRGRHYGAPVAELLGGPTRQPVRVYGSCLGFSVEPEKAAARAAQLKKDGFRQQKWFLAYGPGDGLSGLERNVALVRALRAAVGEDVELMFDAFMGWDLQYAIRWAKAVEPFQPAWIEEAFPVADLESFIALSRATSIPVATGEHFYNRWEVQSFLKAGAIQYVQADPEWCGGVSELVKICHLASVHGAKVVPHGHNIHAALHVVAGQSPSVCPLGEYLINYMPQKVHFQQNPLLTANGLIDLPARPGFGIELDAATVETQEVLG